jgi:VanZ family protein
MASALSGVWRVGPAVVYTVFVFVGGTRAGGGPPGMNDKLMHALAFGGLALLVVPALAFVSRSLSPRVLLSWSFLVSTAVGGALEVVQHFLPYRTAELADLVADGVGAAIACSLFGWWTTWRSSRNSLRG